MNEAVFMRRRIVLTGLVIVATGLLIGLTWLVYVLFIRNVEAEENKLGVPTPEAGEEAYHIYVFDLEQTTLNFTIDSKLGEIKGTFDIVGRWFEVVQTTDAEGWTIRLVLDIDGRSVETGNVLANSLIEMGFDAERYPIGRFVGQGDIPIPALSGSYSLNMVGQLELSGVVKPLSIPVEMTFEQDQLVATGSPMIDAAEFGANFPEQIGSSVLQTQIKVVAIESDEAINTIPNDLSMPVTTPAEP
jgi:polyisoprenoid-binding protein YceI